MPTCRATWTTIIRPAWLSDADKIAYGTTVKRKPFANAGAYVSRKSVADLIVKLVTKPTSASGKAWAFTRPSCHLPRDRDQPNCRGPARINVWKSSSNGTVMTKVVVVIGAGLIGQAIARRVSVGKHVLLADLRMETADAVAKVLSDAGFEVSTATVDVSSRKSVEAFVKTATAIGEIDGVIHAAGVSPTQASPATILAVDLYGTALVLEQFGNVLAPGGSGVVIASMSGHRLPALTAEQNAALVTTPTEELLALPMLQPDPAPRE